jgi:hypothetical protein
VQEAVDRGATVLAGAGRQTARQPQAAPLVAGDDTGRQHAFGGSLDSGWGRFGTGPGRDDFTEVQLVTSRAVPRDPFAH